MNQGPITKGEVKEKRRDGRGTGKRRDITK